MFKLLKLSDIKLDNKRVLLRVDYNVVENGKIIDEYRIKASLPTIKYLLKKNCSIILISHNGRPNGKKVSSLSLRPIAKILPRLVGQDITFVDNCIGKEVENESKNLNSRDILLLENLRFHKGEETNSKEFAKKLASLADIYIDDAFGAIHRAHASIVGVPKLLPHAAGLLVEKEYATFSDLNKKPARPYAAVIGGVKVSDKIDVLKNLIKHVDVLLIGGAMANTFLMAAGCNMQKSILEKSSIKNVKEIEKLAKSNKVKIILPLDLIVSQNISSTKIKNVGVHNLNHNDMALDIGSDTVIIFEHILKVCKTVFWNGTLGWAEVERYANASQKIAKFITSLGAKTVVGGGDTVAFVNKHHLENNFNFVSTGGGASLELLAGKKLPGIEALKK